VRGRASPSQKGSLPGGRKLRGRESNWTINLGETKKIARDDELKHSLRLTKNTKERKEVVARRKI